MIDDNVAGLSSSLGSDDALGGDDLAGEGGFILVNVDWDGRLIPVWLDFEEVLFE